MSRPEAHFRDDQWADFVRGGLVSGAGRAAMEVHLQTGCQECAETVRLFEMTVSAGLSARLAEVPEKLTAAAVALFQPPQPERGWIAELLPLIPELLFSTGLDWQPAGVRGGMDGAMSQRSVFRAGDYSVDVSLEGLAAAREVVGQISHSTDGKLALDEIIVQIIANGKTLSETSTNRFGEFIIDLPAEKKAILRLALKRQGYRIDLPL